MFFTLTSCGTLQVRTAHDRRYIMMANFTKLMSTNPGEKNMPIHTMPWLLTRCRIFSAILKSPYWGNFFSRSQHQQLFISLTKTARKKSTDNVAAIVITRSKTVILTSSWPNIVSQHRLLKFLLKLRSMLEVLLKSYFSV